MVLVMLIPYDCVHCVYMRYESCQVIFLLSGTECNKCNCRCKADGSFPPLCRCTKKRCHGTAQGSDIMVHQKSPLQNSMEKNTTCEDSEGKTRQVGEKWNGKQDCNSCQCNCGSDGKPHCGVCTRKACVPGIY